MTELTRFEVPIFYTEITQHCGSIKVVASSAEEAAELVNKGYGDSESVDHYSEIDGGAPCEIELDTPSFDKDGAPKSDDQSNLPDSIEGQPRHDEAVPLEEAMKERGMDEESG